MSFIQIRGSVPVYWSQPGYKYRPPPRLDRGLWTHLFVNIFFLNFPHVNLDETETQLAFQKHFDDELNIYGNICIINLVEQTGKEKVIFDAYAIHTIKYNSDKLLYVTFDFHEYWYNYIQPVHLLFYHAPNEIYIISAEACVSKMCPL